MHNQRIGQLGERYAAKFLISQNYRIIDHNFHSRFGEIDLITFDYSTRQIVFVEVKTRQCHLYGYGEHAINYQKIDRMLKTAHTFIQKHHRYSRFGWRLDLITVRLYKEKLMNISHYKNIPDG